MLGIATVGAETWLVEKHAKQRVSSDVSKR